MRPTTISVLGQPFAVEYQKIEGVTLANNGHSTGATDMRHLRLLIHDDQHERQLRDTVLHEVLHAALHVQEMDAEDEAFVARVTPVLLDVLRSNPVLVAWLTE